MPDIEEPPNQLAVLLGSKEFMLLEEIALDLQELNNSKWSTLTPDALFLDMLQDAAVLYKNCTIKDLVVIGKVLECYTGRPWYNHKISKAHNVNTIVEAFDSKNFLAEWDLQKQEKTIHNPKSLYYIACNFMKEHWKPVQLQVSYALSLHKVKIEKWEQNCPIDLNMTIPLSGNMGVIEVPIFSYPEFSIEWNQVEFATLDYTHISTNMHGHILKNGCDLQVGALQRTG